MTPALMILQCLTIISSFSSFRNLPFCASQGHPSTKATSLQLRAWMHW